MTQRGRMLEGLARIAAVRGGYSVVSAGRLKHADPGIKRFFARILTRTDLSPASWAVLRLKLISVKTL